MATAMRTSNRQVVVRQKRWAAVTLAASTLAVGGIAVLPWFNKSLGHRSGSGRTFYQNYAVGADNVFVYFAIVIAFVVIATVAFIGTSRVSSWVGIALGAFMLADGGWKMGAWLNIETEFNLAPGVGFYSLMAGASLALVASVMLLVNSYAHPTLEED